MLMIKVAIFTLVLWLLRNMSVLLSFCEQQQQQNAFSALQWSVDAFQNIYNFLMRSNKAAFVDVVFVAVVLLSRLR